MRACVSLRFIIHCYMQLVNGYVALIHSLDMQRVDGLSTQLVTRLNPVGIALDVMLVVVYKALCDKCLSLMH